MKTVQRLLWLVPLFTILFFASPFTKPTYAASTCAGYIPASITTPDDLNTAVIQANSTNCPGADVIDLNGATITYMLSYGPYTALPLITSDIALINGTIERGLTAPEFRMIENQGILTLNQIMLRNGSISISNGGGIYNAGQLMIQQSTLTNNLAIRGGGLYNSSASPVLIERSTFSHNRSTQPGSAIGNLSSGILTLSNSTITENTITGNAIGTIYSGAGTTLQIINSTIRNNHIQQAGASAAINGQGNTFLYNSILSDNVPSDCVHYVGTITFSPSLSNIIENDDPSHPCGTAGTDYLAVDPQLGPLTGFPAYYPIASAASPAVNAGDNASTGGAILDQSGTSRIQNTEVDLGSHESPFVPQVITVRFAFSLASISESLGMGNALRVATSDGLPTSRVATVSVGVTGGTATLADYNLTGTITIPAGTADNALVSVASGITITNELMVEPNETLQLALSSPIGAILGAQTTMTHTISNDDNATVMMVDVAQAEGNSGTSNMSFMVFLNNPVQGGFTLNYTTTDILASTADSDYTASSGMLTFLGNASETHLINVIIHGDTKTEGNETFRVSFPSAIGTIPAGSLNITGTAIGTIINDDTAALTIADVSLTEGNAGTSIMTFTVTLSNTVQGGFTVNYATANGTANTADNDYVASTGTLTFAGTAGETETFTVTINGDTKVEANETFTVSLNTVSNTAVTITDTATGTINNDDTAALTIADMSQAEGNAGTSTMIFTVTLNNTVQGGFTVNYATADGTATTADNDYVATTGTLPFTGTAGETRTFIVTINGDTKVEANETFTVSLNTVSNTAINITDTATGTINNDDIASVTLADVSQAEGNAGTSTMTFTATLNNAVQGGFTVNYATADGTATTADNDYVATTGTLPFTGTAGETRTFVVTINGDTTIEPNETFTVSLNTVSNAAVNITDTATGTIINDDTLPALSINDVSVTEGNAGTSLMTFIVSLSAPASAGGVTFDIATADGTATTADNDYVAQSLTGQTIPAGSSTYNFNITINGDSKVELNENFFVNVTNVTGASVLDGQGVGTINNDDTATVTLGDVSLVEGNAGTSTMTFTATLNNAVQGGFTVNYATADGTATTADSDYVASTGTLTFAGTASETETFTVTINGDTAIEPNETFTVSLNTVSNAAVNITDTATGTIINDDTLPALSINDVSVTEGNAGTSLMTFIVSLSAPASAGGVTFDIATADGTATTADNDYVAQSLTGQTIPAGSSTYNFNITINGDSKVELNENFFVNVTNVTGASVLDGQGVGTINNDDTSGYVVDTTATASSIAEPVGTTTFTIRLLSEPNGTVMLDFMSIDTTECVVSPSTFTFNAGNWNTNQVITISAVDDLIADGTQPCAVMTQYNLMSTASEYSSLSNPPNVPLNVTDNDTAGISLSSITVTEGQAGVGMDVVLTSQPTSDVTINFTPDAQCTLAPATLTFTNGNWNTVQSVTVTAVDDALSEGAHTCVITYSASSIDTNYVLASTAHNADVVDNDTAGISLSSITVTEGQPGLNMNVELFTEPTADVTINFTPDAQCTLAPATLTFTNGAGLSPWNIAQQTLVTAVNDTLIEGVHSCVVSVSVTSTDANYGGLSLTHNITMRDNDSVMVEPEIIIPAIPAEVFLCGNLREQTNGAMTGSGDIGNVELNGTYGNTYCTVITLRGEFLRSSAQIGNASILAQGVVHAVDVYGLLPSGNSVVPFLRPAQICFAGSGSIYFLSSVAGSPPPVQLPTQANSPSGYACVSVPNAGKVVLVSTASTLPPALTSSTILAQGACQVTTTFAVRLRTTPDTSSDANVITMLPFDLTLVATEYLSGWYRVIYLDGQGWVSENYLNTTGAC